MDWGYIIAAILAAVTAVAFYRFLTAFLAFHRVQNQLLDIAEAEFREHVETLLKRPEELPREVLDLVGIMSDVAFRYGSERDLLRAIQGKSAPRQQPSDVSAIRSLTPEAREAFYRAATAWLNIMTNKSTLGGVRIAYALSKAEVAAGKLIDPPKAALPAVREMVHSSRHLNAA